MKKIELNEEFSFNGNIWSFTDEDGKVRLKSLRKAGKSKPSNNPTLDEVKVYFKEKGYTEEAAIKFYDYYSVADWKDAKGNIVKNWKQKAMAVWFKPENKIKEQTTQQQQGGFIF